jgi:hypothetical protein
MSPEGNAEPKGEEPDDVTVADERPASGDLAQPA